MKFQSIAIATAFLATSAAFAGEPTLEAQRPRPEPSATTTVLAEVTAGMREILRAATPEIALPALEVKLPKLDLQRR